MKMNVLRHGKWFESAYRIGIAIKGFDGMVELITGLALLIAPSVVHTVLSSVVGYAHQHTGIPYAFIAQNIAKLDDDLAKSGLAFLIIFLIGHGIVKIVLVYCLLRRIIWAYPYALFVLVLFLVYQLYVLVQNPLSIGMWAFTVLDIAIIWLVWGEYADLREAVVPSKSEEVS